MSASPPTAVINWGDGRAIRGIQIQTAIERDKLDKVTELC